MYGIVNLLLREKTVPFKFFKSVKTLTILDQITEMLLQIESSCFRFFIQFLLLQIPVVPDQNSLILELLMLMHCLVLLPISEYPSLHE